MQELEIDFATGQMERKEIDHEWAEFAAENEQVNKYMKEFGVGETMNVNQSTSGAKFKPFEFINGLGDTEQTEEEMINSLNNFQFKACKTSDEKTT